MSDYPPPKRGRRGPAPKGNRRQRTTMFEVDVLEAVEALAKKEGLDFSDVVTRACAREVGMPVPRYCYPKTLAQEKLPLAEAS